MLKNTPWAHLPNAAHIDWVLDHYRARQEVWANARPSQPNTPGWGIAWGELQRRIQGAGADRYDMWVAARDLLWGIRAPDIASNRRTKPSFPWARNALLALIAADYAGAYFDMPLDAFKVPLAAQEPAAVLLYHAVLIRHGLPTDAPLKAPQA